MEFSHVPVLLDECLEALAIRPDGIYADGTVGGAGHSSHILQKLSPKGLLIGIDRDSDALEAANARLSGTREAMPEGVRVHHLWIDTVAFRKRLQLVADAASRDSLAEAVAEEVAACAAGRDKADVRRLHVHLDREEPDFPRRLDPRGHRRHPGRERLALHPHRTRPRRKRRGKRRGRQRRPKSRHCTPPSISPRTTASISPTSQTRFCATGSRSSPATDGGGSTSTSSP